MAKKSTAKKSAGKKPTATKRAAKAPKYVYTWGNGKADGNGGMKPLLGGKGANLAEIGCTGNAGLLTLAASVEDVDWNQIDLMIECIPERLDLKQALFARLAELAPESVLLASNSSSFPISAIAQGLPTRARMLGLHFFMPAHIVPLAEVVLGPDTDADQAESVAAFMRRCGSVPIIVRKDVPGFVGNRLQHALAREAFSMIEAGIVSPEDIDNAVRFGFGLGGGLRGGGELGEKRGGIFSHRIPSP